MLPTPPALWSTITPTDHDVRLVVCDMDGTLLDCHGEVPPGFWPTLQRMHEAGIAFVPASGRQHATLAAMFAGVDGQGSFIAENGMLVVHEGEVIAVTSVDQPTVSDVISRVRRVARTHDLGVVVCGRRSAHVERTDPPFLEQVRRYYAELALVDDLDEVTDEVLKLAIFDFDTVEDGLVHVFDDLRPAHQVVVSGEHWVDIMMPGTTKGTGVEALQRAMGITADHTVAFGDYLNDLELLDAAGLSFAVANAHPEVRARARYLAPGNDQHGVVTVIDHLLGHQPGMLAHKP